MEGQTAFGIFEVCSVQVKLSTSSLEGKAIILKIAEAGELLGVPATLPVIGENGTLVGVISMDDLLQRGEAPSIGKGPELSTEEVVRTYRAIDQYGMPQIVHAMVVA